MNEFAAAVILGASQWPKSHGRFPSAIQFANSARAFLLYCQSSDGLGLAKTQILNLFDDPSPASTIDEQIATFLDEFEERNRHPLKEIVVYYTGHGTFTEVERKYCLAVRDTRANNFGGSAYRASTLARTLRSIPRCRRYVIIDACYSSSALADFIFQSSIAEKMEFDVMDAMAEEGTALLCAASPTQEAITIPDDNCTMFSGALFEALLSGSDVDKPALSFEDVRTLLEQVMRRRYKDRAVRSQMHVPDQRKGDISKRGIFPNKHYIRRKQQGEELARIKAEESAKKPALLTIAPYKGQSVPDRKPGGALEAPRFNSSSRVAVRLTMPSRTLRRAAAVLSIGLIALIPSDPTREKPTVTDNQSSPSFPSVGEARTAPITEPSSPTVPMGSGNATMGTKYTQRLNSDGTETDRGPGLVRADLVNEAEGKSSSQRNSPAALSPSDQSQPGHQASGSGPNADPAKSAAASSEEIMLYEERIGQSGPTSVNGTVFWSAQPDTGSKSKNELEVQGLISIPGRGLTAQITITRNHDTSLPASHLVKVVFSLAPDFAGGHIDSIQRIAMKASEQDRGNALIAVPAKITDDFHMIALDDFPDVLKTNLELLRTRDWIDIPIRYGNGHRALITLQKGKQGREVFNKVIDGWGQQ